MTQTKLSAMKQAQAAAEKAFDSYLELHRATATNYVPECVIAAAQAAYAEAGGRKAITVRGHGNRTHPVCSVEVVRA